MYYIMTDVRFTRRKRVHCVFDSHDVLLWTGKNFEDVLTYLTSKGVDQVELRGPTSNWVILLKPLVD